jgi:hypothetical protein
MGAFKAASPLAFTSGFITGAFFGTNGFPTLMNDVFPFRLAFSGAGAVLACAFAGAVVAFSGAGAMVALSGDGAVVDVSGAAVLAVSVDGPGVGLRT